jgi:Domain of unknown function (DUF2804), N-terminal/Domain of unknown function (DUF2804), C-terminal
MQKQITERTDILDDNGHVFQSGWALNDLFNYEREKITSGKCRIKEWDFWEVFNDQYRVVLNIFDIGYAGVAQFTFTDFNTHKSKHAIMLKLFTKGSVGNPKSWKYDSPLIFTRGKSKMEFDRVDDKIILKVDFPSKKIKGEFSLQMKKTLDSMVNLIPFENPKKFVYAVKVMCLPAEGNIKIGDKSYDFNSENNSWGVLDWTRAVFPYKNHWKWCCASGKVNGVDFGFNIDYGFGKESAKSMIIHNGKGHHLDTVKYQHDKKNLMAPLVIKSPDGRVDLILKPKYLEKAGVDLGFVAMKGVNTYGYFTGNMKLDDGTMVEIKESDKLFGWAEEFSQKW